MVVSERNFVSINLPAVNVCRCLLAYCVNRLQIAELSVVHVLRYCLNSVYALTAYFCLDNGTNLD